MAKNKQHSALIARLTVTFAPITRTWPRLAPYIAQNWPVKALSLAFALLLFAFHRMSSLEERVFSIPLRVEVDDAMIPASAYTKVIHITLRGDPASTRGISAEDIEAYIDLEGKSKGVYRLPVQVRKKGAAAGVEPLEISVEPLEIALALDYKLSKRVPLSINMRGIPQQGYELVSYTLTPEETIIEGPLNVISGIDRMFTDVISLDGRSDDFSAMVNMVKQDPLVELRGSGMAEFRANIREIIQIEHFDDQRITPIDLNPRFSITLDVNTCTVSLEAAQRLLKDFRPPSPFLTLDCAEITASGTYTLPVSVAIREGFAVARRDPETVRVHITERGAAP
ncbi:MAG: hypothetical protein LBS86_03765 [Treponema sp.]|jgi:YbbR domain-containing protein|nr:hypothetical protein [Treponema sp.]